jgi:hypothetical protein
VAGLAAGALAGALLGDGLGGAGRVGRGRRAGVGGIGAEAGLQVGDERLQVSDLALQGRAEALAADGEPVEIDAAPNGAPEDICAEEPQASLPAPDAGMVDNPPDAARNGVCCGDGEPFEPI